MYNEPRYRRIICNGDNKTKGFMVRRDSGRPRWPIYNFPGVPLRCEALFMTLNSLGWYIWEKTRRCVKVFFFFFGITQLLYLDFQQLYKKLESSNNGSICVLNASEISAAVTPRLVTEAIFCHHVLSRDLQGFFCTIIPGFTLESPGRGSRSSVSSTRITHRSFMWSCSLCDMFRHYTFAGVYV